MVVKKKSKKSETGTVKLQHEKGSKDGKESKQWKKQRFLNHEEERAEIKQLEERIAAEAPKAGSGSNHGAGAATEAASAGTGPALTGGLFSDLPLSGRTMAGLKSKQYVKMTEIQSAGIPHALAGRDLLGEARTGSGKTLTFLVPCIELLFRRQWTKNDGLGGLVVSPTKELAYQIFQVLTAVGGEHDFSAGCVVGGRDLSEEQSTVCGMNVLIATPGRLLQHLDETPGFDASNLQMLIFDEADRILDFGFQETVHHILGHLPTDRQTLLFSATLHTSVHRLGRAALKSPEVVSVHKDAASRTPDRLKQVHMRVPLEQKVDTLFSFLRSHSQKKTIVFVSACKQVRFLYESFRKLKPGPAIMELHGRQSLTKRMIVFNEFTERERAVALICTDIAARGVDFPAVDWVVQLDCPESIDSYIHRVGRTARYQSSGHSALFLTPSEEPFVEKMKQARIQIKSIATKKGKVQSMQQKLNALLAGEPEIKHLAQKAFVSYVRGIALMKDKEVFKTDELPLEAFADSLGLALMPEIGPVGKAADVEKNPLKAQKNQSKLQRLKDKIRAKKEAAKTGKALPDDDEEQEEAVELGRAGAAQEVTKTGKLGKWERRQRRVALAAAAAAKGRDAGHEEEEDDLLQPVQSGDASGVVVGSSASASSRVVPSSVRTKKLRISKDGVAQNALGQHTVFTESGGSRTGDAAGLAQLAEELKGDAFDGGRGRGGREAFLQRVADDLAKRDTSDAAVSRARIHERHLRQKRLAKGKKAGGQDDDDDVQDFSNAVLGGEDDASSAERSPSPPPTKPAKKPVGKKRQAADPADAGDAKPIASNKASKAAAAAAGGSSLFSGGDLGDLGDLERQALSRLGSGGLFG
eukprot:TRINITY_DN31394_c0_g1_i1.p1 TRINITY_DN31394_c0_g1~~TRINITY_DN31394_c0_g1_i1.p1  ORF type:complete len:867 (+),score=226.92 TRINITY_DN31394_c0_g1_i1:88-2688(+)